MNPGVAFIQHVTQQLLAEWVRAATPQDAALTLIHRQPGAPWTVESLAERVSLARTTR